MENQIFSAYLAIDFFLPFLSNIFSFFYLTVYHWWNLMTNLTWYPGSDVRDRISRIGYPGSDIRNWISGIGYPGFDIQDQVSGICYIFSLILARCHKKLKVIKHVFISFIYVHCTSYLHMYICKEYQIPDPGYPIPDIWSRISDPRYPIPDTWSRISNPGYPIPDIRSWIPDPENSIPDIQSRISGLDIQSRIPDSGYPARISNPKSRIPYFHVALPTFDAVFTSVGNLLVTAGKLSICGNSRGNQSVNRCGNHLVTAGWIFICGNSRGNLSVNRCGNLLVTAGHVEIAGVN